MASSARQKTQRIVNKEDSWEAIREVESEMLF